MRDLNVITVHDPKGPTGVFNGAPTGGKYATEKSFDSL